VDRGEKQRQETCPDQCHALRYLLGKFEYDDKDHKVVGEADPLIVGRALAD
jgi:hypothetical protein